MSNHKKLPLPILILIIGLGISLAIAGFGFYKQTEAQKINEERANTALEQSETAIKAANARLAEIEEEYNQLKAEYNDKANQCDNIIVGSEGWFAADSQCQREKQELNSQLWNLEAENMTIKNKDYTAYYQKVEPMSYQIFYIIAGAVAGLAALGAFIIYLVKGKKSY